ncbi:unnamed protein product [Phyllotreta striolata]|uniref:CN hydrolase domain-containing protein n=1 Tax=Phyllotreta striolata TaxID=444603 RepID=A0A9N9TEL9_PHYSR|nr:unnamed protein product [Phyllotreta striolata]
MEINMFNFISVTCFMLFTFIAAEAQTYTAGVVVYKPEESNADDTPDVFVSNNVKSYVDIIQKNQNKVDILVFPEYGLTGVNANDKIKEHLPVISTTVGNISELACHKNKMKENLVKLSCAAKENNVYVVANVVEQSNDNYYITTVAFDTKGYLRAKCRKHHLVNGSNFEESTNYSNCSFTATFKKHGSVPFTILFGNDLLRPIPQEIKTDNVIVTAAIKNSLPLNIGFSVYQGFAVSNGVNVLASGYYQKNENPAYYNYGGSGIFLSNGTGIVSFSPDGSDNVPDGMGTVIQQDIPIVSSRLPVVTVSSRFLGKMPKLSLDYMNITGLNDTSKIVNHCVDSKVCCNFSAEFADETLQEYKWIAFSNKTVFAGEEVEVFVCALAVESALVTPKSFRNVTISSTIEKPKINQSIPIAVQQNYLPVDFVFNNDTNLITLTKEENIVVFGIVHVLSLAGPEAGPNVFLIVIITLLCIALVVLLVGYLIWRKRQRKNRRSL